MIRFIFPGNLLIFIAATLLAWWAFGLWGMVAWVALFSLLALSQIP